jgi:hypothetical protein
MTLIEVAIAAAIAILMAAALFQLARGSRPFATASAASSFDAAIAFAKSVASTSGNGATLVFTPASPAGFTLRIYSGRPTSSNALSISGPRVSSEADVSEAVLGGPPFTIFFDGSGAASAQHGAVTPGEVQASDPGCPAGEPAVRLTFKTGSITAVRTLACQAA